MKGHTMSESPCRRCVDASTRLIRGTWLGCGVVLAMSCGFLLGCGFCSCMCQSRERIREVISREAYPYFVYWIWGG